MVITKKIVTPVKDVAKKDALIKRVAAYCRVSTDTDSQEESYDSQAAYYRCNKPGTRA